MEHGAVEYATPKMSVIEGRDYIMPLHDTIHVGGVSESCKYNCHEECRAPGCGCTCHQPQASQLVNQPVETGPEKSCPTCGSKRPFNETYCRIDGAKLSSLACNICGRGREPSDKFCFNCGSPAWATADETKLPNVINVPAVEPEISYAESVLKGLQEELDNVQQTEDGVAHVVEQPAGSQGSFKLVSKPNPNKVRVPAGGQQPVSNGQGKKFKLPIKPS